MRRILTAVMSTALLAGCGGSPATPVLALSPVPGSTSAVPVSATPAAGRWPMPGDCVSYDPTRLSLRYEQGAHVVADGVTQVLRLRGASDAPIGQQALALARRYRQHCYLGRANKREDPDTFRFDYWREPSGQATSIAGEQDNCSTYEPKHLVAEDMGQGDGWRVRDHDHILHVFDTEADARAGVLVLGNFGRICFLGGYDGEAREVVTYFP